MLVKLIGSRVGLSHGPLCPMAEATPLISVAVVLRNSGLSGRSLAAPLLRRQDWWKLHTGGTGRCQQLTREHTKITAFHEVWLWTAAVVANKAPQPMAAPHRASLYSVAALESPSSQEAIACTALKANGARSARKREPTAEE